MAARPARVRFRPDGGPLPARSMIRKPTIRARGQGHSPDCYRLPHGTGGPSGRRLIRGPSRRRARSARSPPGPARRGGRARRRALRWF